MLDDKSSLLIRKNTSSTFNYCRPDRVSSTIRVMICLESKITTESRHYACGRGSRLILTYGQFKCKVAFRLQQNVSELQAGLDVFVGMLVQIVPRCSDGYLVKLEAKDLSFNLVCIAGDCRL